MEEHKNIIKELMEKKRISHGPYGSVYLSPIKLPHSDVYKPRWEYLRMHKGLKEFCLSKDCDEWLNVYHMTGVPLAYKYSIEPLGKLVYAIGSIERVYFCRCVSFYGNIHKLTFEESYRQFNNNYASQVIERELSLRWSTGPVHMLGTKPKPRPGHIYIDIDCHFRREDILRIISKMLTVEQKKHRIVPDSKIVERTKKLFGYYFEITERHDLEAVNRYLAVAKIEADNPCNWRELAFNTIQKYRHYNKIDNDTAMRELNRDLSNARNIIYWSIRGYFPKTSKQK